MALIAVAVTLGTPNAEGQVPITTTNLAAEIAQAVTDLATLATAISTAQTAATAADNDVAQVQTDETALQSATTALTTATAAVVTDYATNVTDYNAAMNGSANNLLSLLNLGASNAFTYNTSTFQFGGSGTNSSTMTVAEMNALIALLNTFGTAFAACQTAATTANTDAGVVQTDLTTLNNDLIIAKSATATSKTDALALSTTTVSADLVAAQAIIASANVYLQSDTTIVTNIAFLNGALVSALAFIRNAAILPQ